MPLTVRQLAALETFVAVNNAIGKGPLSVLLVVTQTARTSGLPLHDEELLTKGGGQVRGLGQGAVQSILTAHGINRVLAREGGRTSRGSVGLMKAYVRLLNDMEAESGIDFDALESWLIDRVGEYFSAQPFVMRMDQSQSVRSMVRDLLSQAERRQAEAIGTMFVGAVLQHLVGAKLALVVGDSIPQHGAFVADAVTGRAADFEVQDTAIHVTVTPTEALLRKCRENLERGLHVIIITTRNRASVAETMAEQEGIGDRVDVFDAEQFIATNLHEHGGFTVPGRQTSARQLVEKYNAVVAACETDPSLRIDIS